MKNLVYLYGKNTFNEAIFAHKRGEPLVIEKLYITKDNSINPEIIGTIQSNKIPYEIVTREEIESKVGRDAIHQGICGELKESLLYTPLEKVLLEAKNSPTNNLFVLLDELEDPHNVGAIIRSAVAFGARAVLLPDHDQVQLNGTVIKTSSGMNFAIPIVKIGNVNTTLRKLKDDGFWIYGLTGNGDTVLHDTKFDSNTVIVVGSEGSGIRAKTLELCDFKLSIATSSLCESLNASNATAVTLYEWKKQN